MAEVYDDVNNLPKDLGEIEFLRGHPQILQKLIEYSKLKSLKPFIEVVNANSIRGGFDFGDVPEKWGFWNRVLNRKEIQCFYIKYPKVNVPDLAEIKQKFPVGSVFNNNNLNSVGLASIGENIRITKNCVYHRVGDNWELSTISQGTWTIWCKGQYADIILPKKVEPPYLLDVQRMFPIGTVFNNSNLSIDDYAKQSRIIKTNNFLFVEDTWQYKTPQGLNWIVWKDGKYADIIEDSRKEKKSLLEQAKERYPIGTIISRDNIKGLEAVEIEVTDLSLFKESLVTKNITYNNKMIYDKPENTWANIKSETLTTVDSRSMQLLNYARTNYPPNSIVNIRNLISSNPYNHTISERPDFNVDKHGNVLVQAVSSTGSRYNLILYYSTKKEWAEIITARAEDFGYRTTTKEREMDSRLCQAKMRLRAGMVFTWDNGSRLSGRYDRRHFTVDVDPIFEMSPVGNIYITVREQLRENKIQIYDSEDDVWVLVIGQNHVLGDTKSTNPFPIQGLQDRIDEIEAIRGKYGNPYVSQQDYAKARVEAMASGTIFANPNAIPPPLTWGISDENVELANKILNNTEFTIEPMKEIPIKEVSLDHIKFTIEKLK